MLWLQFLPIWPYDTPYVDLQHVAMVTCCCSSRHRCGSSQSAPCTPPRPMLLLPCASPMGHVLLLPCASTMDHMLLLLACRRHFVLFLLMVCSRRLQTLAPKEPRYRRCHQCLALVWSIRVCVSNIMSTMRSTICSVVWSLPFAANRLTKPYLCFS